MTRKQGVKACRHDDGVRKRKIFIYSYTLYLPSQLVRDTVHLPRLRARPIIMKENFFLSTKRESKTSTTTRGVAVTYSTIW